MRTFTSALALAAGLALAETALAECPTEVLVNADITTATVWTNDNTYNLQTQIYVRNGATLVIEAGTVVATTPTMNGAGSLAVTRGSQIFVLGNKAMPVIMTSTADVATWSDCNPHTGEWRAAANEWGNLTIMGRAYISENDPAQGNVPTCNANNTGSMEGLTGGGVNQEYGGGMDDDDSGTIKFLSLRYGGRVVGVGVELNGMSLGGIGRGTDIHHVEIMNNVDDGIEIFGGTVNLKYISIWNIGDDSFDIDQGWRGKAQFLLIVQGYSLDAPQGSGVGDNCFETDGAEDSDWQPVSTGVVYNATVIGQPASGDHGTAWRDNARIQYHNCIFMDVGDDVVHFDNVDGDGANGYGFNGTLSWPATWTTPFNAVPPHANDCPNPGVIYQSQTSGFLAEIVDSVFFRNADYTEANNRGVFNPANNNFIIPGVDPADAPVTALVRGGPVLLQGGTLVMLPVQFLDPAPKGPARVSVGAAPNDGFFTPAHYRGAFPPRRSGGYAGGPIVGLPGVNAEANWLCGWTASQAFGFTGGDSCNGLSPR